jgi:WhiB family redox-sensing transcriptional regulator
MNELYLIDGMLEESDAVSDEEAVLAGALAVRPDRPRGVLPRKGWLHPRGQEGLRRVRRARSECLEYALANDERFGIWGGLSERERRKLKKRAV